MVESLGLVSTSSPEDGLIAGDALLRSKKVTIKSGSGVVARGTVLGKIKKQIGAVVPGGGNSGNGTVTSIAMGTLAKIGSYLLTCKTAVADGGVFSVQDPDGYALPDATVGVAYVHEQINFTITDGSADWVVGDTLAIPVETPTNELWIKSLAAAVDGSQELDSILTETVDATSAAVVKSGYITGDFNENKLIFGAGHTKDSLRETAQAKNIFFHDVQAVPVY